MQTNRDAATISQASTLYQHSPSLLHLCTPDQPWYAGITSKSGGMGSHTSKRKVPEPSWSPGWSAWTVLSQGLCCWSFKDPIRPWEGRGRFRPGSHVAWGAVQCTYVVPTCLLGPVQGRLMLFSLLPPSRRAGVLSWQRREVMITAKNSKGK